MRLSVGVDRNGQKCAAAAFERERNTEEEEESCG
jgi:hypothetical protein